MASLSHRWILNLNANETQTKWNNPSGIIDRLEILTIGFSISYNATLCVGRDAKANEVEDEVRDTHVDSISVKNELTIMWPSSRSFYKRISNISNTNPNTANKVKKQIDTLVSFFQSCF